MHKFWYDVKFGYVSQELKGKTKTSTVEQRWIGYYEFTENDEDDPEFG